MKRSSFSADNMIALPSDRVSRSDFFCVSLLGKVLPRTSFLPPPTSPELKKNFFPEMIKKC